MGLLDGNGFGNFGSSTGFGSNSLLSGDPLANINNANAGIGLGAPTVASSSGFMATTPLPAASARKGGGFADFLDSLGGAFAQATPALLGALAVNKGQVVQGGGVTTGASGYNPNDLATVALQQQAQQRQQITNLITYAIIGVVLVVVIVLVFRLTKTAK